MSRRTPAYALVALFLLSTASASSAVPGLHASVKGLRNAKGRVGCLLFDSPDGFPSDQKKARQRALGVIADGAAVCQFDVPTGSYAIVAMHDENANGKLDANIFGVPTEGYGASKGAQGAFGPKYGDARFDYRGGSMTMPITLKY
ncbi:MAG TPA: DUF2141 domain-containing protein [Polyangiaceae bacterium]